MSYSSKRNPNVVKTALDDVFNPVFSEMGMPGHASAMDGLVFKQDSVDNSAVIMELFAGSGAWKSRTEEQDVNQASPKIGDQKTFSVTNWANSIDIPKNFFDDNMHGAYEKMVRDFALKARYTRDYEAFKLYRDAFNGTYYTTHDGVALISDSHTTLGSGETVDNKLTGALSYDNLNTAIQMLQEQKSQDGTIIGHTPDVLLVPPALRSLAERIVYSAQLSGTADNDMNPIRGLYNLTVKTSPYLGAASGGSDTAWFLLSTNHSVTRWTRQGVVTDLVDYKYERNNNYIYKGEFREMVGAMTWEGIIGSTGAA